MNTIPPEGIPILGFSDKDRPSSDVINTCVHCGLCLPTCPTYRVTGLEMSSPRGRIYLMKGVSEGTISLASDVFQAQMGQCLNCRACEAVCPSGVLYGPILEASRAQVEQARAAALSAPDGSPYTAVKPAGAAERAMRAFVFGRLFKNMALFRAFSNSLKLYQRTGLQSLARGLGVLKFLGLADSEGMLPRISERFTVPSGQVFPAEGQRTHRVAMLAGCIMGTAFDHVHQATIRVLQKNGCDVVLPANQGCCGALHTHGGDLDGGRELARANIMAFEAAGLADMDAIIVNAAGCGSTLKEYGHLLHDDPAWRERGERFSRKVKDVHEFLASIELNRAALKPLNVTVTYQEPCHLAHAQRITAQPRKLLQAIPGLTLREMPESALCCGSAGIYNVTQPEMAAQLGARKIDNALSTQAEVIATANPGCALQLAAELRKRPDGRSVKVKYIVELLDEAYRG